jgi:hypothetical protein
MNTKIGVFLIQSIFFIKFLKIFFLPPESRRKTLLARLVQTTLIFLQVNFLLSETSGENV